MGSRVLFAAIVAIAGVLWWAVTSDWSLAPVVAGVGIGLALAIFLVVGLIAHAFLGD